MNNDNNGGSDGGDGYPTTTTTSTTTATVNNNNENDGDGGKQIVFKRITIDSNVASIPRMVANMLLEPASEWCTSENECRRHRDNGNHAFYDTPISMCSSEYACGGIVVPSNFLNFVYLDYRLDNPSLRRIRENLIRRRNVVLVLAHEGVKNNVRSIYRIKTTHCSIRTVAEAIATIINAFRSRGRLLHPDDISDIVCGKKVTRPRQLDYNMIYDICSLMARRNKEQSIVDDCEECIVSRSE